jgi:hypothetical protein
MSGPVNARTDPETGLRTYLWQGIEVPSVTSIRRVVGMPFDLHNWALSQVIDRAVTGHDVVEAMLNRPAKPRERVRDKNVVRETRTWLRAAATEQRDRAGDRGTRIHDAISIDLPLAECDSDVRPYVAQWRHFMTTRHVTVVWAERQIWNLTLGYAGTADALLGFPDGHTAVVDYKSSSGVYIDHAVQLAGYAMAEFVGENDVRDEVATAQLKNAQHMGVLHLGPTFWEYVEIRATPALLAGFAGSLAFARFLNDHRNSIDPLVVSRISGGTQILTPHAQENSNGQ